MTYSASYNRAVREHMDRFARAFGYRDAQEIAEANKEPLEVIRDRIESNPRTLADLFTGADLYADARVHAALKSVVDRDDLHACDLLLEIMAELIDAKVDEIAKEHGVGPYFDAMALEVA